jgi:hypothetical protein
VKWQQFLEKDRNILVLCIFAAAVIWALNSMTEETRSSLDVYISVETPNGFVLAQTPEDYITVGIEGTGWQLLRLARKDSLFINITPSPTTNIQTWNNEALRLKVAELEEVSEISLISISPSPISLSLDSIYHKKVSLSMPLDIGFAKGFSNVHPLKITPDSILLSGPRALVEKQEQWVLDTLRDRSIRSSLSDSILLKTTDERGVFKFSPPSVRYELEIAEFTELKQIKPIHAEDFSGDSISLFPHRALLSMKVPIDKYDEAEQLDKTLILNPDASLSSNSAPIQLKNSLPYWVKNIKIEPRTAEFFFISTETDSIIRPQ